MSRWEWEGKVPAKWTSFKAPDLEEELKERPVSAGIKTETSTPTWNGADLEFRYHRKELQDFMTNNPIMRILQPKQSGDQTGPVTAPATADNKLEAIKILMNLLQEADLVAGAFDAEDLFRPDLRIFRMSTKELFDKLKIIVGEKVMDPSTTSIPNSPTQIGSTGDRTTSPFVSAAEANSDASSEPQRMSLGPAGAAMLQARSKVPRRTPARSKAKKTSGAVRKPTPPQSRDCDVQRYDLDGQDGILLPSGHEPFPARTADLHAKPGGQGTSEPGNQRFRDGIRRIGCLKEIAMGVRPGRPGPSHGRSNGGGNRSGRVF
ncbi:hypothetical protein PF008_g25190 [Phytophthora fragariae]|uniref:Uncharacterized protein n=1 Tax=Phytophthora fragariae TaxID=53985 RepID=A0A6G0QKP7_9STRA|nr:hypothetical protein PF008_g25190 [Phytophthora fragariae]